jgi:ribosomal protein S18 acetylase RimI-like enzyme
MNRPTIRNARGDERDPVAAVMTVVFSADPFMRWVYPKAEDYLQHFPGFVERFAGAAFDQDAVFVAPELSGASLWFPPGTVSDEEALGNYVVATVAPDRLAEMAVLLEQMQEYKVEGDAWYLPMIGVDGTHRGQGVGAELMQHVLKKTDRAGLPTHLESSNPANIPFYERLGFEAVGKIQTSEDAPVLTPMVRAPR